jgi:spore coat protein U-like protein
VTRAALSAGRIAALAALAALVGAPAGAALAARCSASTSPVSFLNYDVFSATDSTITGGVTVTCQREGGDLPVVTVTYTVGAGTGSGGSFAARKLKAGSSTLGYNVYTTANYTTIWGNGTGSTAVFGGSFVLSPGNSSGSRTHTAFGRIPARQDVPAGTYTDSLVVTVSW